MEKKRMIKLMAKRKEKGLTQSELAEKIGVKKMTIYNYEAGERSPTVERLEQIAEVLECNASELI